MESSSRNNSAKTPRNGVGLTDAHRRKSLPFSGSLDPTDTETTPREPSSLVPAIHRVSSKSTWTSSACSTTDSPRVLDLGQAAAQTVTPAASSKRSATPFGVYTPVIAVLVIMAVCGAVFFYAVPLLKHHRQHSLKHSTSMTTEPAAVLNTNSAFNVIPLTSNHAEKAVHDHAASLRRHLVAKAHNQARFASRNERAVACSDPSWLPSSFTHEDIADVPATAGVQDLLAVTDASKTGVGSPFLVLGDDATLSFTFISASSALRNAFGFYAAGDDGQPTSDASLKVLFPDLSAPPQGCLEMGDTVSTGSLPAGKYGLWVNVGGLFKEAGNTLDNVVTSGDDHPEGSTRHFSVLFDEGDESNPTFWIGISEAGGCDFSSGIVRVTADPASSFDTLASATLVRRPSTIRPRITGVTETTMEVSWTAGASNGAEILGFTVYVMCDSVPGGWAKVADVGSDVRQYTITGLLEDTEYLVSTVAFNEKGDSDFESSEPATTSPGCNKLGNPSFEVTDGGSLAIGWNVLNHGYQWTRAERVRGQRSIRMNNLPGQSLWYGANAGVVLQQTKATTVRISGNSKAKGVAGDRSTAYAILVDVAYADGTNVYGLNYQFQTGTHDWETAELLVPAPKPIDTIWISLVFRGIAGDVWFDDLAVCEDSSKITRTRCSSVGDPHVITYDEKRYDLQAVGHFHLTSVPSTGFDVQLRQVKAGKDVSTNSAVAMVFAQGGVVIALYRGQTGTTPVLTVDGVVQPLPGAPGDATDIGGGVSATHKGSVTTGKATYHFIHPDSDVQVEVVVHQSIWKVQYMDVHVLLPSQNTFGSVEGLCGNMNGNPYDDVLDKDSGNVLSDVDLDDHSKKSGFADSWRVVPAEDLIAVGAAQASEEHDLFHDQSFPPVPEVQITDLAKLRLNVAKEICANKGVGPDLLNQCAIDLISTNDVGFATSAALTGTDFCRQVRGEA